MVDYLEAFSNYSVDIMANGSSSKDGVAVAASFILVVASCDLIKVALFHSYSSIDGSFFLRLSNIDFVDLFGLKNFLPFL